MASPYQNPVTPISDITPYFKKTNDASMIFTGTSLEVRIPLRFTSHGVLIIDENVTSPGIFDMIIDDKYQAALNLLASITMIPSDQGRMTYKGIEYLQLFFKTGDVFMTATRVLQDSHIVYVLWTEFISNGQLPYMYTYKSLLALFEHVVELTGSGIGVTRSVYEAIIAHLSRDQDNVSVKYRLTDMKKPMQTVALKSVSQAPTGTVARLNGSYFRDEGMTSALRTQVTEPQPFENLLRGLRIPDNRRQEDPQNFSFF